MPTPYFDFKKFRIYHDLCAMKVGTDGVLLGAWANCHNALNILDIGCGTGLISIMSAQKANNANIIGLDIDNLAIKQAKLNVRNCLWKNRIKIEQQDFFTFESQLLFDSIICNPPFYEEDQLPPLKSRQLARNTKTFSFEYLIAKTIKLLSTNQSTFSVIIPTNSYQKFHNICQHNHLYLNKETLVITIVGKQPKRVLLEYSKTKKSIIKNTITLSFKAGIRSKDYINLTKDFYL